jgi:hypothetical protein
MAKVFFSYSHKDEELRNRLEVALKMLQRQGLIEAWHDRRIVAGDEFNGEISQYLEEADIVLLLVSPDFLASDYCYDVEMGRAMERHHAGDARVIPVILRRCDWHHAPFSKLMATPPDGKPIRSYPDLDDAFQDVAEAIRKAVPQAAASALLPTAAAPVAAAAPRLRPRSSNLSLPKTFTDRDRDQFLMESFDYLKGFFSNSLEELKARNEGIDTDFREIDRNTFMATLYVQGRQVSRCTISLGDQLGRGIAYVTGEMRNGFNEMLRVESDAHGLFLKSMGMAHHARGSHEAKLTQEGGAELFWEILIANLRSQYR